MTNNLNEKRSYAVIIAAIICSLAVMIGGMAVGLVYSVRQHNDAQSDGGKQMAQHLLVDSAYSLKNSMSALRLCNEEEPAEELNRTALIHAVRAETALECHTDDWADSRSKEAFLNDIATVLHSYPTRDTINMSEKLYEYAAKFYGSVALGEEFEYDGELIPNGGADTDTPETPAEVTDEDKAAAAEFIKSALGTERAEFVGAWNGHLEFYTERDSRTGYALVCGEKIKEFSFTRDENVEADSDTARAEKLALEVAEACGYKGLSVRSSGVAGKSIAVILCRNYDGAVACDDAATAVVYGGKVVAFSAGGCDHEHKNIPTPKKTEREASKSAIGGGEGTLVVRTVNGRERICYEYRYELDDGVHYVYVCAESGKQMQVK